MMGPGGGNREWRDIWQTREHTPCVNKAAAALHQLMAILPKGWPGTGRTPGCSRESGNRDILNVKSPSFQMLQADSKNCLNYAKKRCNVKPQMAHRLGLQPQNNRGNDLSDLSKFVCGQQV